MTESHLYHLSAYDYVLPKELIAQEPVTPRDHSRLLIVDRKKGILSEARFDALPSFLERGDRLIFNNTRVIPARLIGKRETGGETEIFLLKDKGESRWEVLGKPGRKLKEGSKVHFGPDFSCVVEKTYSNGHKLVQFIHDQPFELLVEKYGKIPLPQYIGREESLPSDKERYQTIYAEVPGALAAPTAGLHFTHDLIEKIDTMGVDRSYLTLHVGLGTFKPVQVDDIRQHEMHSERVVISPESAAALNRIENGKRRICVGTTSCRALESAADEAGKVRSGVFDTDIFIYPGYRFKAMDALITNFHLPGSTLLMLVSAFAGYDLIMEAYRYAVAHRFRFYSYGDAMLII